MGKSHRNQTHTRVASRPGEGYMMQPHVQHIAQADGRTATVINVDLNAAPVPDRRYVADVVSVLHRKELVHVLFGQEKVSGTTPGLRSLIVLHMPPYAVKNFVTSVQGMKNPSFGDVMKISGLSVGKLTEITEEPTQTVAMTANLSAVAVSGHEACIDFYQNSAFSKAYALATNKIAVDPVVRVEMPTSLLAAMLEKLEEISRNLPKEELRGG